LLAAIGPKRSMHRSLSIDRDGKADPYVRVAVDGARLHTHTVHDTLDPVWDEAFYMPVHGQASRIISDYHFAAHHNHFVSLHHFSMGSDFQAQCCGDPNMADLGGKVR
jgi:hypothetical protein